MEGGERDQNQVSAWELITRSAAGVLEKEGAGQAQRDTGHHLQGGREGLSGGRPRERAGVWNAATSSPAQTSRLLSFAPLRLTRLFSNSSPRTHGPAHTVRGRSGGENTTGQAVWVPTRSMLSRRRETRAPVHAGRHFENPDKRHSRPLPPSPAAAGDTPPGGPPAAQPRRAAGQAPPRSPRPWT